MTDVSEVKLQVNGEARTVPGPLTVAQLLQHLGVETRQVGVERNRTLVLRAEFDRTELCDGDEIEIVTFVGGG